MPGRITAEEVKTRLVNSRAELVILINKWELSGNDFGQRPVGDDDFSHLDEDHLQDGDNRQSLLGDFQPHIHIIYYWHLADNYDILTKVLCVLDPTVTTSNDSVPLTEGGRFRKRKGNDDEENQFRESITQAMGTLGYASLVNALSRARKDSIDAKLNLIKAQNDEEKDVWRVAVTYAGEADKKP